MSLPFLPGNSFADKTDFRKPHYLGFVNGYAVQPNPKASTETLSRKDLLQSVGVDNDLLYGKSRYHQKITSPCFVPSHIAFDKVVLRFDGYFKQVVHECREQYHLRKVRILYFLEDDTISVIEPPVENSGISQGVLIKRQKLAKASGEYYTPKDFNIAQSITFYGKTFRIVSCDKFTRDYMTSKVGTILNAPEEMPKDQHQESRIRVQKQDSTIRRKNEKLKGFLEKDRMVLRFYCAWDDRISMFGELREFIMHYHLVDDSIEIREVQKPNSGRDPFPILLRRQSLPKVYRGLQDTDGENYTWKDLRIGQCINVLGRPFLLRDCDAFTRKYYSEAASTDSSVIPQATEGVPMEIQRPTKLEQPLPLYNGYGTVEDSMGSCKYLVPRPPKKDSSKIMEDEHKILRFVSKLVSNNKEDQDRRFVLSYRLSDDTITIYEPPQRNTGILGGKFMERTKVIRPGYSLSEVGGPKYYDASDLYVGGKLEILCRQFVLIDADEFVFNFMESEPKRFEKSNPVSVEQNFAVLFRSLTQEQRQSFREALEKANPNGTIGRGTLIELAKPFFPSVTDHELITYARLFEISPKIVGYTTMFAG